VVWFALNDDRPLVAFAGIWTTFNDNRGTKSKPVPEPNAGIMLAENGATVPQIMAALGRKTPKMALYYCRLPNQKLLADPAADVLDLAFAGREEGRQARIARRRGDLKLGLTP
jgi:hypothetical protein